MGDSYDDDEGRLMIDDAILDSTHSSQPVAANTEAASKTSYEKTVELTPASEDVIGLTVEGVESHPVDPEPKPSFYCESGVPKVVQGAHRDDRLKVTIRRTQSPVNSGGQFTYLGEKRSDGVEKLAGPSRSEDISKEEGEIDDEEETCNSVHAQSVAAGLHQPANWTGYQSVGFDTTPAGSSRFRHSGQQCEHHALYSTPHSGTRQLAVNISVSSTVTSPGPPIVTGSVTVEEHNLRALSAPYSTKRQASPVNTRLGSVGNQVSAEAKIGEGSAGFGRQNIGVEGSGSECAGIPSSPGGKARKKKRRTSERDERENYQAASSSTSVFNFSASQSCGASPEKKKKPNTCDRSTCVCMKSVQTNDVDVDAKIGSTHCLTISVLAKASNYVYFVTNWNGRELYGILGDGLPPMQHTYMNKRNGGTSLAMSNVSGFDLCGSHDKTNGSSPSKQRSNSKRTNRSASVCPVNGFPDTKQPGRKGLVGTMGRPSSASTSDVQSVGGDLQDEERSQSPVSWFTSGANDPVSVLGSLGTTCSLTQLRECISSTMYSCPVAGCEHRYDAQSQLAIHYHTHFVKENGGRAIYVESMGSQTDAVITKDAAVDPVKELTGIRAASLEEIGSEVKNFRGDEKTHSMSPRPKLSKTLTNHEEQSINELFKVVAQKTETSSSTGKVDEKKPIIAQISRITATANRTYSTLLTSSGTEIVRETSTALDAIRKMVTNSENEAGPREQHPSSIISTSMALPSCVTSATPHGGAASPAFSDISDDAPTLEKEVADKSEERSLDRIKELVNNTEKSPLGQLSLSIEGEKGNISKGGIGSSNLLCPVSSSTTTTMAALSVPRVSADTGQSSAVDGAKKSDVKPLIQTNTLGTLGSPFMDPSLTGLRPASSIPMSMSNLSNAPSAPVFAQPYFMPFLAPSVNNTTTPGISQSSASRHKIHDLKANPPNLISSQSKESNTAGQPSSVVASPSSRPVSQGGLGNIPVTKQMVHQQAGNHSITAGNSFTGVQTLASSNNDRAANSQNAQSTALNFMQHQQQQAYLAQLQQHQQLQYMQRFGAGFPMTGPPNSMNAVAQQAYEQMAALHASFGFPGMFMPPSFPPK